MTVREKLLKLLKR